MDLIIRNAILVGQDRPVDLAVQEGKFKTIGPNLPQTAAKEIDAGGRIVIPPFIEPHIHLDTVLTAGNPRYNASGSHPEGIVVWGEYKKANPNYEDMKARARKVIEWEIAQGTLYIRTHIDICDPNLTALKQMLELREEFKDLVEFQIVAFPQDGILAYDKGKDLMRQAMELGADLLGAIPHCEWTREDGVASLEYIFDLAAEFDRDIDVHCDETDDEQSRFLEVMAALTIRKGFQGRVSAGHTTAMHSYNNAYAHKLTGIIKQADINVIANPFDNMVLQARFDTYPKRRGLTRVKELMAAGVNVSLGHDSIMDPWYPLGQGDMISVAQMAIHACHMSGYREIHQMLDTVTVNSARTFGISQQYGIRESYPANLVILDAFSVMDVMRISPARLFVIKSGQVIASTVPAQVHVHYPDRKKQIDFQTSIKT